MSRKGPGEVQERSRRPTRRCRRLGNVQERSGKGPGEVSPTHTKVQAPPSTRQTASGCSIHCSGRPHGPCSHCTRSKPRPRAHTRHIDGRWPACGTPSRTCRGRVVVISPPPPLLERPVGRVSDMCMDVSRRAAPPQAGGPPAATASRRTARSPSPSPRAAATRGPTRAATACRRAFADVSRTCHKHMSAQPRPARTAKTRPARTPPPPPPRGPKARPRIAPRRRPRRRALRASCASLPTERAPPRPAEWETPTSGRKGGSVPRIQSTA